MDSLFDQNVEQAYAKYLEMPKFDRSNIRQENIYDLGWCVHTGLACFPPHPHRHYTLVEFAYNCGKKEEMYDRFIKK